MRQIIFKVTSNKMVKYEKTYHLYLTFDFVTPERQRPSSVKITSKKFKSLATYF
jgi:hypothetical protein